MNLEETKKNFRLDARDIRDGIDPQTRAEEDEIMTQTIIQTDLYQNCKYILTYVSTGSEADTHKLIDQAIRDQKGVYVPKICGDNMTFFRIESLDELHAGVLGILEPDADPVRAFPYSLHLSLDSAQDCVVIVPGLAFDTKCNRIGHGKGYYDRFLSHFRKCMSIGLCYTEQIQEEVPVGPGDVSLDLVVTPGRAYF